MSTTTKFTPGEWKVFDHYCGRDPETAGQYANHRLVGLGQFDTVADVRHGHDEIEGDVDTNARLIAAAPELYEALKRCLQALESDWERTAEVELARAALAKVEAPRG